MLLADRVRDARAAKGWSARELDKRAGLAPGHTALIESGVRPNPAAHTMAQLAGALGLTIDALVPPASPEAAPDEVA